MKLATAKQLAAKFGLTAEMWQDEFHYRIKVDAERTVWFELDYARKAERFYFRDEADVGRMVVTDICYERPIKDDTPVTASDTITSDMRAVTGHATLASALAAALSKTVTLTHGDRRVGLTLAYDPRRLTRTVAVTADGVPVIGRLSDVTPLAQMAVDTGCVAPLIDYIDEHDLAA